MRRTPLTCACAVLRRFSLLRVLALAFCALCAPARGMEFVAIPMSDICRPGDCQRVVMAQGEITGETPQQFAQFLQQEMRAPGLLSMVFLNSPGGNVESALRLGALFHDAGASVVVGQPVPGTARRHMGMRASLSVVPGQCASACVYTLMGAKRRVVPSGAKLGVHRMSARVFMRDPASGQAETGRVFAGSSEIDALRAYVARVGGSQDLISLAESVPHDRIRVLSDAEIRRYRLGGSKL